MMIMIIVHAFEESVLNQLKVGNLCRQSIIDNYLSGVSEGRGGKGRVNFMGESEVTPAP